MVTPLQNRIYQFIEQYINEQGYSPSLVEIARGVSLSPNSISLISRSVHALVKAKKLKFHKKGYRNIEVVDPKSNLCLTVVGRIAAGTPIEAVCAAKSIDLTVLFSDRDHFVLEVKGDSMVDEGILDGDLVICKPTQRAEEGDIVVALIDQQEATLKRVSYKIRERITLIPANPNLQPKVYLPQRVQIQGVLQGLLRLKK